MLGNRSLHGPDVKEVTVSIHLWLSVVLIPLLVLREHIYSVATSGSCDVGSV